MNWREAQRVGRAVDESAARFTPTHQTGRKHLFADIQESPIPIGGHIYTAGEAPAAIDCSHQPLSRRVI